MTDSFLFKNRIALICLSLSFARCRSVSIPVTEKSHSYCAAEAGTHNRHLAEFATAGKLLPVASTKAKVHSRSHSQPCTGIAQIAAPQIVALVLVQLQVDHLIELIHNPSQQGVSAMTASSQLTYLVAHSLHTFSSLMVLENHHSFWLDLHRMQQNAFT